MQTLCGTVFAGVANLPKFNTLHPTLARFLLCAPFLKLFHVEHCHTDTKNNTPTACK